MGRVSLVFWFGYAMSINRRLIETAINIKEDVPDQYLNLAMGSLESIWFLPVKIAVN